MNLADIAAEACYNLDSVPYDYRTENGIEIAPGFFNLYNNRTGQSRTVLYHPESGYVFKLASDYNVPLESASGKFLGTITILEKTYRVRLAKFLLFGEIEAQEYVIGDTCPCNGGSWCTHSQQLAALTACGDAHTGNWLITGDEIVLFDYESLDFRRFGE